MTGLIERLLRSAATPDPVDFVKMDVEGAEREILADASAWADRVRAIKVEVHAPYTLEACRRDLERAGFETERDQRHRAALIGRHRRLFLQGKAVGGAQ